MHLPHVEDNGNGSVGVYYQPTEAGPHNLDVRYNGEHVQGSPYKFYASPNDEGKVYAYGPGLTHGVCGDPSNFVISTKGAGAGGLALAVEGPSKADINCIDNKDGTVNVSYLPTAPGEYKISARFAGTLIMSPTVWKFGNFPATFRFLREINFCVRLEYQNLQF